jgi:general secretion pathway protein B
MSLILDALKQAERENRLGQSPDLSSLYEEEHPKRRLHWVWVCIIVLLLINAVVLTVVYFPRSSTDVVRENTISERVGFPDKPLRGDIKEIRNERVAEQRPKKEVSKKPVEPTAVRKTKTERIASLKPPLVGSTTSKRAVPFDKPIAKEVDQHTRGASIKKGGMAISSNVETRKKKYEDSKEGELSSVPDKLPPLLKDLPSEIKDKLPPIDIIGHVYDNDPAKRFVFINAQSYRVGDRIGRDGPLLDKITSDGVIIDYGGGLARVPIK